MKGQCVKVGMLATREDILQPERIRFPAKGIILQLPRHFPVLQRTKEDILQLEKPPKGDILQLEILPGLPRILLGMPGSLPGSLAGILPGTWQENLLIAWFREFD